jgi:regulator of vacuolar morphogenesis
MPVSKHVQPADPNDPSIAFTSSSWLDAHTDVVASVRDIRSDINKRDALAQRGELGPSGSANTQAKKKLALLLRRLDLLAHALEPLSRSGMSSGELHRRTEMVARLQDDCEKLAQMLVAARNYTPSSQSKSASDPRAQLLAQPSAPTRLVGRVFGAAAAAQETEATRPLDNQSLLQLQEQQVHQQDEQLEELTAVLRRQKQIGIVIGDEIQKQITMLDEFDADLDQFGNKMYKAKKNLNRLDG